jgi:5'-nucleotidase
MVENTPFDDNLWMLEVTGAQWRRMIQHILRDDAWLGETEFYQFSRGVRILYNKTTHTIEELKFNGEDVTDDMHLKIALQNYHYKNFDAFLGVPLEEVKQNMRPRVVATSVNNIIEEFFATNDGLDAHVEGRLEVIE